MQNQSSWTILAAAGCMVLFSLLCVACHQKTPVDLVIHNVSVIDVENGDVNESVAVVIRDGDIIDVIADKDKGQYQPSRSVDGSGRFLIPALSDGHVHILSGAELQNYLLYGVGLVVNMSGHAGHLELKAAVESGEVEGPSILSTGPTLDGDSPTNPLFTSVNPDIAPEISQWIRAQGYDAVKIYQQMDEATLRAVIDAASSKDLLVTGHVSRNIGIDSSINAGQRYFAHGEELSFEAYDEESRTYRIEEVPGLAKTLAAAATTTTPMLRYVQDIPAQALNLEAFLDSADMQVIPAAMRMSFGENQGWFSNREDPEGFSNQINSMAEFVSALTLALNQEGADMILGTDAGFGGAIPGLSVHQELESMVRAGLTELEALQMATLKMGEYAQKMKPGSIPRGKIEPGYRADLLLLEDNPLNDITATRSIQGVLLNNHWHDENKLESIRSGLVDRQRTLLPLARAFETALISGDLEAGKKAANSIPGEYADASLISPDNCIFLGYRHYYGGNRVLAGQFYELCAQQHPHSHQLWIHIARAHEAGENTESAIQAYARASALNPWYGAPRQAIQRLQNPTQSEE